MNLTQELHKAARLIIHWAPLIALPFMLNVRWNDMVAANEEPKWAIFLILGSFLTITGSIYFLTKQRSTLNQHEGSHRFALSLPGVGLFLFWLGLALGVTYTVNFGEGMNRLAFWSCALATFLAVSWSTKKDPAFMDQLKSSIAFSTALLSILFWHAFFFDFSRPEFNKFVQFSRIGHFNFTADALMFLIPLNLWITITPGKIWMRALSTASLISGILMLLTSGSMGGMLGLLAGGLVVGAMALFFHGPSAKKSPTHPKRLLAGLVLVTLSILIAKPIFDHMPEAYRDQMFVRAEWWNPPEAKALESISSPPPLATLWVRVLPFLGARTPMWASTSGMIADHPWTGFGTGSFLFEYPGYSKRYDLFGDFETQGVKVKTNPHNVLLQIASENGIPMMLLFLGLYLWLLVKVVLEAFRERSPFWLYALWILLAVGLDAMVNHVFLNPASLFLASISFGLFHGQLKREKPVLVIPRGPLGSPLIWSTLAIIGCLYLNSYPLRWIVSEFYVAKAIRLQSADPAASKREISTTWVNARIWSPTNIQALFGLSQWGFSEKQYGASERYLEAMLKIAPNHTAAINLLANIQANTNRLDEAEQTLNRALKLEPDAIAIQENLRDLRAFKENPPSAPEVPMP